MTNVFELVVVSSAVCYVVLLGCVVVWWKPKTMLPTSGHPVPGNFLTIVIAARNEAESIGNCLRSLLPQEGVARIIVVDDQSADDTARAVAAIQSIDPRVECLPAPPLPPGWIGKSHALHFGASQVNTPLTLFTDADVIVGPGIIPRALHERQTHRLDHLGGHFHVDCRSVAEEICAPVLVLSSALALFGAAERQGAGTGAFNLVRTEIYRAHGGHGPIQSVIVDDVAIARHLKSAGARSSFVMMGDGLKVRLFVGFQGFIRSVARSSISFLKWNGIAVLGAASVCMAVAIAPLLALAAGVHLSLPVGGQQPNPNMLLLGLVPLACGFLSLQLGCPLHNGRQWLQLCFPVPACLLAGAVFCAAVAQLRGKPLQWRGRSYAVG